MHERQEAIIGDVQLRKNRSQLVKLGSFSPLLPINNAGVTHKLVFLPEDIGNVHVVGGRRHIFVLLASEDVEGGDVGLGVTVLSSLGSGHFNDLTRTALDDNVTVLAQSRALHGEGVRRASVGGFEGLVLYIRTSAI